jgi:DNA polymerase-3 subunit delta'
MFFKDIVGQQMVAQKLRNSFTSGRLGHATLFTGKEGHGALPLTLAFSRFIMCRNRSESDACGACPSCKKFDKLIHPDVHFIFPVINKKGKDPVSDSFISDWRKFLITNPYYGYGDWIKTIASENKQGGIYKDESDSINRKLSMKSFEGEYKIMIIWMAEKMNDSAANKILKILEEPPQNTLFFLIAVQPEQLLQTIISRTQGIPIPPIDSAEVERYLIDKRQLDSAKARDLALFSEGDLGKATELFDKIDELQQNIENFSNFLNFCKNEKTAEILSFIDTTLAKDRNAQIEFIQYILHNIRHNVLGSVHSGNAGSPSALGTLGPAGVKLNISLPQAKVVYKLLNDAVTHIERNVNSRIVLMDVAIQLRKNLLSGR